MLKKENKWSKILVFAFLGFTVLGMTFSFVFYGFSDNTKVKYKGYKFRFEQRDQAWMVKVNNNYAAFSFLPAEVEQINVMADLGNLKNKLEIDVTSDINDTNIEAIALAQHQMTLTLQNYNIFIRSGLLTNNTYDNSTYKLPVIKCSDATPNVPVLIFRTGNSTAISQEENCIIVEADDGQNMIKAKDRVVYSMLGII